jgi:hypothetical protein
VTKKSLGASRAPESPASAGRARGAAACLSGGASGAAACLSGGASGAAARLSGGAGGATARRSGCAAGTRSGLATSGRSAAPARSSSILDVRLRVARSGVNQDGLGVVSAPHER